MVKGKKTECIVAWCVYAVCTVAVIMLSVMRGGSFAVPIFAGVLAVALTYVTFFSKVTANVHAYLLMTFLFINILMSSLAVKDVYASYAALIGSSVLLMVYKSTRLLAVNTVLSFIFALIHMFAAKNVGTGEVENMYFLVRTFTVLGAQTYLTILMHLTKKNERKLQKRVDDAQRAEHYKSDFLANMSHEIRTPMNSIVGMCEMVLREKTLSESVRENCQNIQTSGRNLLSIINDILDFSKIESGKSELIEEEFNIASTLADVLNMCVARKGDKKIEIIADVDPNLPAGLMGDEIRIRQVMVNIMTNAIKFTQKGTIKLTISQTRRDYGINLCVSVRDTGIGIMPENIEKLFTSFQQVDTKKNRAVEGTGLGLAISKKLVNNMGGFISVKSEYGKGSEFKFVIPLKVRKDIPFVKINEPAKIHAVSYTNPARYNDEFGVDQYRVMFENLGIKLGIDFKVCSDFAQLEELVKGGAVTHCFIGSEDYPDNAEFYDKAGEDVRFFAVQDRMHPVPVPKVIKSIYKPFYVRSIASALNDERVMANLSVNRVNITRFTAPGARVLIVDDNPINLKVAAGLMRPYNMDITTVNSGFEAVEVLKDKGFDLVFMDHMMPKKDGVETTHDIRAMAGEYYQKLPIIALTANAVTGAREIFIRSGMNDFLAKPIELNTLDRILRAYLPQNLIKPIEETEAEEEEAREAAAYRHASQAAPSPVKAAPQTAAPAKTADSSKSNLNVLLDPVKGLGFTGGDKESYLEIVQLYAENGAEKYKYIGELCRKKDWENYIIEVHALKSSSLSIGASLLSERAKELEAAGREGNFALIEKKNAELLKIYRGVIAVAQMYVNENKPKVKVVETKEKLSDVSKLIEIDSTTLSGYIERVQQACARFDSDDVREAAQSARSLAYDGKALYPVFERAVKLADDFEYDEAAKLISELLDKSEGGANL